MDETQARQPLPREGEPTMAKLMDPVAWERRLQEARARRAEALAHRGEGRAPSREPRPRSGSPEAAVRASAGPALSPDSRAAPATGPAISGAAGPSIRDVARAERIESSPAPQPTRPDPAPARPGPSGLRSRVTALPLPSRRPPAAGAPIPAPPNPPAQETEDHREDPEVLPLEAEAGTVPDSPSRSDRLEIPAPEDDAEALEAEVRPIPALPVPPTRRAPAARGRGWARPRIALIFAAGLGLGLAGALVLTEPLLEELDELALLSPDPLPDGGVPAAEPPAPVEAPSAAEPASETPATGDDPEPRGEEGERVAAPAEALETPLETRPAGRPEVAALAPAQAEAERPEPQVSPDLPAPEIADAPLLSLPTVIPRPEAPAPVETVRLPGAPTALDAPALPGPPDPESVAGGVGVEPPGVLAATRPRARPAGAGAEPTVDLAALTPEVPAAVEDATAAEVTPGAAPIPAAAAPERVLVHVPSALSSAEAEEAIAAIEAAGYTATSRIDVQIPIGGTNIRYYFPEDAPAARAMAASIEARTGQAAQARDFTGFRPRPSEGTVEVWLAGQPRPAPQRAASPPPAVQPAPPPPTVRARVEPPPRIVTRRAPPPQTPSPADAAMRDLEVLADEIARAIARSIGN